MSNSLKVLGALAVIFVLIVMWMKSRQPTIEKIVKEQRFEVLVPASTLVPPGTVVYRANADTSRLGILCTAEDFLGPNFRPQESRIPGLDRKLAQKFFVSTTLNEFLEATFPAASKVTLSLSNPVMIEIPLSQIPQSKRNQTSGCAAAIRQLRRNGTPISLVSAVLKANVDYTVEFEEGFEQRTETLGAMAESLNGRYDSRSETRIRGENLFWGIRDISAILVEDEASGEPPRRISIDSLPSIVEALGDSATMIADTAWWGSVRIEPGSGLISEKGPLRTYRRQ